MTDVPLEQQIEAVTDASLNPELGGLLRDLAAAAATLRAVKEQRDLMIALTDALAFWMPDETQVLESESGAWDAHIKIRQRALASLGIPHD